MTTRRERVSFVSLDTLVGLSLEPNDRNMSENRIIGSIAAEDILSVLTPRQRQIIVRIAEGKSYREVGEELGICKVSVHDRIKSARKRVRDAGLVRIR